jgi:hypothetical protein
LPSARIRAACSRLEHARPQYSIVEFDGMNIALQRLHGFIRSSALCSNSSSRSSDMQASEQKMRPIPAVPLLLRLGAGASQRTQRRSPNLLMFVDTPQQAFEQ